MSGHSNHVAHLPAHAAASNVYAGSASCGCCEMSLKPAQCSFPAPPPKRCYCSPAQFSSLDGRRHARMQDAYGNSRPCQ